MQACLAPLHQESWVFDKIFLFLMQNVLHVSTLLALLRQHLLGFPHCTKNPSVFTHSFSDAKISYMRMHDASRIFKNLRKF